MIAYFKFQIFVKTNIALPEVGRGHGGVGGPHRRLRRLLLLWLPPERAGGVRGVRAQALRRPGDLLDLPLDLPQVLDVLGAPGLVSVPGAVPVALGVVRLALQLLALGLIVQGELKKKRRRERERDG